MTNQEAMRVKHFLAKVLDRKSEIVSAYDGTDNGAEDAAVQYVVSFEQTAIEALDLLGEIEWPDESRERGDI